MSYRTYINGVQILGNNEYYPEWIEFIKAQGIKVDEEQCYEGEITDFMGALVALENVVIRLNKERNDMIRRYERVDKQPLLKLFDFSNIPKTLEAQENEDGRGESLFDMLIEAVNNSYAFLPYAFFSACEDKLEKDKTFAVSNHWYCYKLKDGETLKVEAH